MKIRTWAALAMVMASSQAMSAVCTSTTNLGTIAQPGSASLFNTFYSPQSFTDCYTFSLSNTGNVGGLTWQFDFSNTLSISLTSVSLGGVTDTTANAFGVNGLTAGNYQLAVNGVVTGVPTTNSLNTWSGPVGYVGVLYATGNRSVPEPGTLGLFGLALVGVALGARRRKLAA